MLTYGIMFAKTLRSRLMMIKFVRFNTYAIHVQPYIIRVEPKRKRI